LIPQRFVVAGTLMIEPTESEARIELDRFIDALSAIREEIAKVENGQWTVEDNPLVFAPHTAEYVLDSDWNRAYAAFPSAAVKEDKFWPTVTRNDDVNGDRNLVCSCSVDTYRDE